jgi:hypothetical protein
MVVYSCTVRFSRNGEYEDTENFDAEIPKTKTSDDDIVEALMDEIREQLDDCYEGDEDWDNGDMSWELYEWEALS